MAPQPLGPVLRPIPCSEPPARIYLLDRLGAGKPLDFRQRDPAAITLPRPAITIAWPDGRTTTALPGQDWLEAARQASVLIPTGCLGGSCGACEIEVNGRMVRACVATVPSSPSGRLTVSLASDPHW